MLGQWWPRTELSKQEAEVETVTVILSTMSSKTVEKFSHKPGIIKTKIINHKEERINFSFLHRKKLQNHIKNHSKGMQPKVLGKDSRGTSAN